MKNAKRILSVLLAVLMVMSSFVTVAAETEPAQPTTWWNNNAAAAFAGGSGTESDPYLISSAAEFAYFAKYLEGGALTNAKTMTYFKLTADIDMSAHQWKPIGQSAKARGSNTSSNTTNQKTLNKGVLDGNNKTISGVKLTATPALGHIYQAGCALFTKIVDSTIKDLNLEVEIKNPDIKKNGYYRVLSANTSDILASGTGVAALAAGAFGNTVIDNVNVTLDLDAKDGNIEMIYAGVVAFSKGNANGNPVFKNITASGTMDVSLASGTYGTVAGVVGLYNASEISNVTNNIDINVNASARVDVGGIVANTYNGPIGGTLTNKGDINATITSTASGQQCSIGGVFGKAAVLRSTMTACTNQGAITTNLSGTGSAYVGGVVAQSAHQDININGYVNTGDVTVNVASENSDYRVGGVAGYLAGKGNTDTDTYAPIQLTNCENIASVSVLIAADTATSADALETYVGGVFGNVYYPALKNCVNRGDVTVENTVSRMRIGGVAGNIGDHADQVADQCVNYGDIILSDAVSNNANTTNASGKNRYVGGIAGNLAGPSITNSHNYGVIELNKAYAPYNIGGITGNMSCSRAGTASDGNTNNADIHVVHGNGSFHRYIGGIHGYNNSNIAAIKNAINNGNIFSDGVIINAYIGGIIAVMSGTTSIRSVVNNGEVKMTSGNGASGTRYVGGATGAITGTNSAVSIVDFTMNNNILCDGYAGGWQVGGVAGTAQGSTIFNTITVNGDVLVNGANVMYVGGIVGEFKLGNTNNFANCTVNGNVLAPRTHGGSGNLAVGGIVGRVSNDNYFNNKNLVIKNCVALGTVSEGTLCGGIIGYAATSRKKINSTDSKETIQPYTVTLNGCVSMFSGVKHGMIGSDRADHAVFENCFADTPYALSYYNQCDDYLLGQTLTINGTPFEGNDVSIVLDKGCYVLEIGTLDKARVNMAGSNERAALRFDSFVSKTSFDRIAAIEGVSIEMGTMIAATENLRIASVANAYDKMAALDTITKEGEAAKYIVSSHDYTQGFMDPALVANAKDENYYFAGYLRNISKENFDKEYTAIAFAKITIGDFSIVFYSDFDLENTERIRSVAQVAQLAFEDRTTVSATINGHNYTTEANADNACFIGGWSLYDNDQLAKLKALCNYINSGVTPNGLSINGVSITEYKIVYAQSPIYKKYGSLTGNTLYDDLKNVTLGDANLGNLCNYGNLIEICNLAMDFDYQTAVRIRDLIKAEYGVELEIVEDASTYESKYEILVGRTNRAKSNTIEIMALSADEFIFAIDGSKLVVCGGTYGTTWHAVDALEKAFGEINLPDYNLKMLGDISGEYYLKKIACIGDSITRGSQALPDGATYGGDHGANVKFGSTTTAIYFEQFLSYPANLQRLMWKDTMVYNFGRGASTARCYNNNSSGNYYAASSQWATCLETSALREVDFDLVFLMHGTNDANQDGGAGGWSQASKDDFLKEIKYMMDQILVGSPNATFVMNNAPHGCYGRNESSDDAIRVVQKETATKLYQMGYDVYHYNMEQYTMDNLTWETNKTCATSDEELRHYDFYNLNTPGDSREGTHPNYRGYNRMAQGIQKVVEYLLFNGAKPTYMIDIR